jgi:hypothetical protein
MEEFLFVSVPPELDLRLSFKSPSFEVAPLVPNVLVQIEGRHIVLHKKQMRLKDGVFC